VYTSNERKKNLKEHKIKYNKPITIYNFINVIIRLNFEISLLFDLRFVLFKTIIQFNIVPLQ